MSSTLHLQSISSKLGRLCDVSCDLMTSSKHMRATLLILQCGILVLIALLTLRPAVKVIYPSKMHGRFSQKTFLDEIDEIKEEWRGNYGKWMNILPKFTTAVKSIENLDKFPSFEKTTDPQHCLVVVHHDEYTVGGLLNAKIFSRDYFGHEKSYGGDIFQAFLYHDDVEGNIMPCEVKEKTDGSYDVQCRLMWSGDHTLRVRLIYPSELQYISMLTTLDSTEHHLIMKTRYINSMGETEYSVCGMGFKNISKSDLCDHSNPRNEEPWFCVKPPSGECTPIIWQNNKEIVKNTHLVLLRGSKYFKGKNYDVEISNSGLGVRVGWRKQERETWTPILGKCDPKPGPLNSTLGGITGWSESNKWRSAICSDKIFDITTQIRCLRHKTLYFLSDSVLLVWYNHFAKILQTQKQTKHLVAWSMPRNSYSERSNTTLRYHSHGPPMHSDGPPAARPYITDTLDGIKTGDENTILIIGLGEHFIWLHPDLFLHRVKGIRSAIERLHQRLPKVQIYVKGLHSRVGLTSWWLVYRLEQILKNEFKNSHAAVYLDMWDMAVTFRNEQIHPKKPILEQQMNLFLSYIYG